MLDLLAEYFEQQQLNHDQCQVFALHYDHAIQEQSAQWADFCLQLCNQSGFPLISVRQAVEIDQTIGLEASARNARYRWFRQVMQAKLQERELKNAILLTAHHCDDQAETLLLNMLRGTGIRGMRGIAEKKQVVQEQDENHYLLRPMLGFSKDEIKEYASENNLSWCEDPSNDDIQFRRNAIRHQVLPVLCLLYTSPSPRDGATSRMPSSA